MPDLDEINEWLLKADEDWLSARVLLQSGHELSLPAMFHIQQMVEKLLKAVILCRG
ncbi:MAG: HEPN domain-containing protein [Balneolaceae bacterium]